MSFKLDSLQRVYDFMVDLDPFEFPLSFEEFKREFNNHEESGLAALSDVIFPILSEYDEMYASNIYSSIICYANGGEFPRNGKYEFTLGLLESPNF